MNNKIWRNVPVTSLILLTSAAAIAAPQASLNKTNGNVEALIYSTMPSTAAHNPTMAMDGDTGTYFKSVYGMDDGDDFLILLSQPIPVQSITITTGDPDGNDELTNGFVETSADGVHFKQSAAFNSTGVASAALGSGLVEALRIRTDPGQDVPRLIVREINIQSPVKITHIQIGPGRGFYDISQAPDLAVWAQKAESQMESFWPDTAALLYSYKFITPNMVNVVYRTGPDVTPVAATGGGVMTVNADWCRKHPEDTGLTVHETAHVIQAMSAYNPVWLIEGTADYIRWVKFEPQNFQYRIDPVKSTYHDAYRTTAAFLGWCELHYDSRLVTKLNEAIRFGTYSNSLFEKFCGKNVDTLWTEFVAAYEADPKGVLIPPVSAGDQPRDIPLVKPGSSVPQDLSSAFNTTGIYKDGTTFSATEGADGGGAAYAFTLLGASQTWKNVQFSIGPAEAADLISSHANVIPLHDDQASSLWLLAAAVDGSQTSQSFTVTFTDGTTQTLAQNLSDWYQPQEFPGEVRAIKMPYRLLGTGQKDPRTFYLYAYGFRLNPSKTVKSLTCPDNPNIKIAAITLAN